PRSARPRPGKPILTTWALIASTASAWPPIGAVVSWRVITRRAQTHAGCVIGFMNFKTSLSGAAHWSAKLTQPLPRRTKPRTHSTLPPAKSEPHLDKRPQRYEHPPHAWKQAMARYDQLDLLLHLLRDALHLCSPFGRLRTVAGVRSELTLLLSLIAEIEDAVLPKLLQPLRSHLDEI